MEKIKAIFIDFDWTLFDHNKKEIPQSTLKALALAHKNGVKLIINSARSYYSLDKLNIFKIIKFDGYVTQNGGCAFLNNKNLYVKSFNKKDLHNLLNYFEEKKISYHLLTKKSSFIKIFDENIVNSFYSIFYEPRPNSIHEYQNQDVVCVQAFCTENFDNNIKNKFPNFKFGRFSEYSIELLPTNYTKTEGIEAFKKYFNYHENELMAIGDENNDINMFKEVKYSVCMGNGHKEAKKAAYFVTTNIDDNGIYNALKHFEVI